jgi:hypothetical protein
MSRPSWRVLSSRVPLWRGLLRRFLLAAVALIPATSLAGPLDGLAPADALVQVWPGERDSSEHVVVSPEGQPAAFEDDDTLRVRTVVSRVHLPWLGARVLYLEEFPHDQPSALRRQLLLRVETDPVGARRVRVFPYTFKNGERWRLLNRSPSLLSSLRRADIQATDGCDLILHQEADQFRGGTTGLDCYALTRVQASDLRLYVDYRVVIGPDVYWYRRKLLRQSDDELYEETIGYNWFAPNDARLFTCRVEYSASGKPSDLRSILRLDLHDQGGHARFTTPDRRQFDLSLHTEDWPYASDRNALLLLLEQPDDPSPVASAWKGLDARQISIELGWLNIRCGPLAPESAEVAS